MVDTEIANIRVCLEANGNPTGYYFVSGALIEKNEKVKELMKEMTEELVKRMFALMDLEVIPTEYEDGAK